MSHDSKVGPGAAGAQGVPEGLRRALVAAAASRDYDAPELHEEVCNHVRALRDRGLPPEQVVVAIKSAVRDSTAGLGPYRLARRHSADLLDKVVRWCIEEYYSGDAAADGSSH